MTLDLRAIHAFLAVSSERSFARAAVETGLSEAVLSRLVRTLEAELAAPLLERRGSSGVTPTAFGELFATEAPRATDAHRRFSVLAERLRQGAVGAVTIGWPAHGLGPLGDELLRAVRRRLPDLDLRTIHPALDAQLRPLTEGHCDLLVVRGWTPDPDFGSTGPIAAEERLLGMSAGGALAGAPEVRLEELRGARIVPAGLPAAGSAGDAWGDHPRDAAGHSILTPLQPAASVDELFRRVRADEGVCLVPAALAGMAAPGDVRFVPAPGVAPSQATLVWRRDAMDAALQATIGVFVSAAAGLADLGGRSAVRPQAR
jgi:DNA-binding transcriptional LysR family regulator